MTSAAPIEPRYLRDVLTWIVDVTAAAIRRKAQFPFPAGLKPFLKGGRVPTGRLPALAREVEADPAFRARLAEVATVDQVGEIGMLWLTRPEGWDTRVVELAEAAERAAAERDLHEAWRRAERRREAAEHAQAALQADLLGLRERHDAARTDLAEREREIARMETDRTELQAALRDARAEARSAAQRAEARASKLAAVEAELLAARAAPRLAEPALTELQRATLADLAKASAELADRVAELERQLGDPTDLPASGRRVVRRVSLVRPGGVRAGTAEEAEFLLRAGAAVLVDGYNVALQAWPKLDLAAQRERLVAHAEDLARRHGVDLTIVFDGAEVEGARAPGRRLVRVVYSPPGVIADDVIRAEVDRVPAGRAVVVVTDDREILRDVKAKGANTISSRRFAEL
jgi:hypothetical protein